MADSLQSFKNLLFDLGGVLYEVDYHATVGAFAQLANQHGAEVNFSQAQQDPIFDQFEVGLISPDTFCEGVRRLIGAAIPDNEITQAWNAMLGGVFPGREELIRQLAEHYPLALLSNTNATHWDVRVAMEVDELLAPFQHVFLSFEIGLRKPHAEVFQYVLEQTGWLAAETLFIEDSPQHIETAQRLGLQTLHLTDPATLSAQLFSR